MRRPLLITFLILLVSGAMTGCKQETDPAPLPSASDDDRPPTGLSESQETFSLALNGKPWLTTPSLEVRADYTGRYFLALYFDTNAPDLNMVMIINEDPIREQVYQLGPSSTDGSASAVINYSLDGGSCSYSFSNLVDGSVHITEFDTVLQVCRGTFKFKSFTNSCDTLKVTNGRFASTLDL
ncbi:hypothetical protein AB9P05_00255 [Roseivirga sp. BDSF3-8]|uniref:hypothetical protein n=1 Tax=Roseivirga sp. BDSF3-8 TaxID=3241598 RepID=UPI0035324DEA